MKSIKEADISNQTRVLVRADLDVPIENGKILDTFRLDCLLPTLRLLQEKQAKIIICGHLGRPDGKYVEELSTKHLKSYFDEKLGEGNYEILENLRFNPDEEENSEEFSQELANYADIYVNESFANSHREHASIVGVARILPSYAGLRLFEEVEVLSKVLKKADRPLVAIIGGAKIETKKPVIQKFLEISDKVLVGGRLGLDWKEQIPQNLLLPVDYAGEDKDIGPETIKLFSEEISKAKAIVWAGPLGMFEEEAFGNGTREIGNDIVNSQAFSVVGGGDTVSALQKFGILEKFNFVSTGGGAMLEFLVKGNLPGLEALGYNG